ncbi:MAG: Cell surface protein [Candidatus Moranbacteria bacterium GW2011_GWA2_39_41]|nr:MAG: Cell surface protein [Candidatus Moranbacteria bacterium GW2011_GWA2_39_41]
MKNKNKINPLQKTVAILLFFSCLLAGFFVLAKHAAAEDKTIIISAVQIEGAEKADDFIELYNTTCNDIALANWKLIRKNSIGSEDTLGTLKNIIPAKGHYLWENTSKNLSDIPDYSTKSYTISNDYSVALFDSTEIKIDSLTWGNNLLPFNDTLFYLLNPAPSESILRNTSDEISTQINYVPKNSSIIDATELSSCPTEEPAPDPIDTPPAETYSDQLRLNELLPNPKDDETIGEYIELYNPEDFPIDLENWILKDSSSTKFVFSSGDIIGANDYLTIYRDTFKFALNNSGQEDVYLLNPNEDVVSETTYENAKEDTSFSFDDSDWKWTQQLTPDKENVFDALSQIKAKHIRDGFVGFPIEFSLEPDYDDFSKVVWEFGDGKKSYLKNPTHTYLQNNTYTVKVATSGETANTSDSFTLKIKNYPREKVEIIGLLPNPLGTDSGQEWLEIKNNDQEIVNLKGWKLATGKTNLLNHPIKDDFEIAPGKSAQLTRENAFFTLNNQAMKLELRYPDGKTADRVSYAKEKIADDEIYSKENGKWFWISAETEEEAVVPVDESTEIASPIEDAPVLAETPVEVIPEESPADMGKFSISDKWQTKRKNWLNYLAYGLPTNKSPRLSPENIALQKNLQLESSVQKVSTKNIFWQINSFLNSIL